jgi:DNA-binding transcriptional ArsR family regulator
MHNLAAHKYLSELGIWPTNHLMTHHPASTRADVRETCRILRDIPHWGRFRPTRFELMAGSPLYEGLSRDERAALRPARRFRLPSGAARYALEYAFEMPETLNPGRDVMRAWSAFARQYTRELARHEADRPRLDVVRIAPDTLRITDTRHGQLRYHDISGDAARIYDACHAALTLDQIARATGLSPETVSAHLARFLRLRLVLRVDDSCLSLALRSRDQLLLRFFSQEGDR